MGLSRKIDTDVQPRVTFTSPEVATVGLQAADCTGTKHRVVTIEHSHLDRAITEGATPGFTQIITDRAGRLVGATIVGPRAGESLGEVTVAIKNRLTATQIAEATHAYPTYNDGVWLACIQIRRERLGSGLQKYGMRALARFQRLRIRRFGAPEPYGVFRVLCEKPGSWASASVAWPESAPVELG